MSERTALTLVFLAMLLSVAVAFVVVRLLHGSDRVVVVVYMVTLAVGADTCSRVSLHYLNKPSSERDRR